MNADESDALVDAATKVLGDRWVDLVAWLRDQNELEEIEQRIAAGQMDQAIADIGAAAEKYAAAVHQEYVQSAIRYAGWLEDKTGIPISFDATNSRAVRWAADNKASEVAEVTQDIKATISQVVSRGVRAGDNPKVIAEDVRGSIGLTTYQESWINSYEQALAVGDWSNARGRELRDARLDRTLDRLERDGGSMDPAQQARAVAYYRDAAITYRSEVIGRTEAMRAVHEGADEQISQAVEGGDIGKESIIFTWIPGPPKKDARPAHQLMRGQERKFGVPFDIPGHGTIRFPGDKNAPIEETAQCRCTRTTRIRFGKLIEFRKSRGIFVPARLLVAQACAALMLPT